MFRVGFDTHFNLIMVREERGCLPGAGADEEMEPMVCAKGEMDSGGGQSSLPIKLSMQEPQITRRQLTELIYSLLLED